MSDTNLEPLERGTFDAARLIIARLRSEAAGEDFDFDEVGWEWLEATVTPVARNERGVVDTNDVFTAALVLLWSVVCARAIEHGRPVTEMIGELGLRLALFEPEGP